MQSRLLVKSFLLFLITVCFSVALQEADLRQADNNDIQQHHHQTINRVKRAVGKPGFFRTLFSVIYEQWSDTKNTFGKVNQMINDNFLPENAPVTEATTPRDPNITTTMAPYKIKRSEFNKIVRRNLRGLVRLFNIELQDALKQSDYNNVEFKKNTSKAISQFL